MKRIMLAIMVLLVSFAFGQSGEEIKSKTAPEWNEITDKFEQSQGQNYGSFAYGQADKFTQAELHPDCIIENGQIVKKENLTEYERGFKNALESLALLALELDLKNERKPYGEMFDILYERYQINNK